jgi:hypothetical protein
MVILALALSAVACKKKEEPASETSPSSASVEQVPETKPAMDDKTAITVAKSIQGLQSGGARTRSCEAMRQLAQDFDRCAECRTPFLKVVGDNPGRDLGDCFLDEIPGGVQSNVGDLCSALATSLEKSDYGTYEVSAIERQGRACASVFDRVIAREEKRFNAFNKAYKDVHSSDLIYLDHLSPSMTAAQKKRLAAAAKKLSDRCKQKGGSDDLKARADKLATLQ